MKGFYADHIDQKELQKSWRKLLHNLKTRLLANCNKRFIYLIEQSRTCKNPIRKPLETCEFNLKEISLS